MADFSGALGYLSFHRLWPVDVSGAFRYHLRTSASAAVRARTQLSLPA